MDNIKSKRQKIASFDESAAAEKNGHLFGLPFTPEEADVVIIPVPWEPTVSYRGGTSKAPAAILEASYQIDVFNSAIPDAWHHGIAMIDAHPWIIEHNTELCADARAYRTLDDSFFAKARAHLLHDINNGGKKLTELVRMTSIHFLLAGKIVGVLGGDHSSPLGLMQALALHHGEYGILHIDAHLDLRNAFEGFIYSHASIMQNARAIPEITHFVHVGVRDFCKEEFEHMIREKNRHQIFEDSYLKAMQFEGRSWRKLCDEIVHLLPQNVYISFDIDGLDPKYCPHTGTPVPGGLEWEQTFYLIRQIVRAGKTIVGFDLCEVAPGPGNPAEDWDSSVGARALWQLGILAAESRE